MPSATSAKAKFDRCAPVATALHADYASRLSGLRAELKNAPYANPVAQLAYHISSQIEAGQTSCADLDSLIACLSDETFAARAANIGRYLNVEAVSRAKDRIKTIVDACALEGGYKVSFEAFEKRWRRIRIGAIFTAHPTFLLTQKTYTDLSRMAEGNAPETPPSYAPLPGITLEEEHTAAMTAIGRAKDALRHIYTEVFSAIRELYPEDWRRFSGFSFHVGTWVGYDLDGRSDVDWTHSLKFRLKEKQLQLQRYQAHASEIAGLLNEEHPLRPLLQNMQNAFHAAETLTAKQIAAAPAAGADASALSNFANAMTGKEEGRLISVRGFAAELEEALLTLEADDPAATPIALLKAEMDSCRLGAAEVHFRLNATQLNNAVRREFTLEQDLSKANRRIAARIADKVKAATPKAVNFASLDVERATAIRQFLLMSQIVKHVDADSPIRMLIAECESPLPPLIAAYFAKTFNVSANIDISPLFETPSALEHGDRIIESLLSIEEYRDLIARRGRLCIQTGFSDAGRFLGQIPATLAIERLQGKLAGLIEASGLADIDALVFDTHGESMGRGAHPRSLADRVDYAMSPWARRAFTNRNINLIHEMSFQGGDGYVLFGTETISLSTALGLIEAHGADTAAAENDPFYKNTDISLDLFNRIRSYQEHLLETPQYHRSLTAFGLSLLPKTGSRKSRRQSEIGGDHGPALRKIRAIPHNAILQQLGYLVNVAAGLGSAAQEDFEAISELMRRSDRMGRLGAMVAHARGLSSIKTFGAYATLYDAAFWATRPAGAEAANLFEPCFYLARLLGDDEQHIAMVRLAAHLRIDELQLQYLLNAEDDSRPIADAAAPERLTIDILHAVRIALIQHIFLLAAQIPPFSPRNDVSREDIMDLIFALRLDEALELLQRAYPIDAPAMDDYDVAETADYPAGRAAGYAEINTRLITPLRETSALLRHITAGIAFAFGAIG
ncbi:MAG: phosphoenolpyruvate carboxylase [Pseudomonadota bacterium]